MSLSVACNQTQPRSMLSTRRPRGGGDHSYDVFCGRRAPTALYHQYQDSFGLNPFAITIIFAAYV
jgi:hypothetical protein